MTIRRGDYVRIEPPPPFGPRAGIVARVSDGDDGPVYHVVPCDRIRTVGYPAARLRAFDPTFVEAVPTDA